MLEGRKKEVKAANEAFRERFQFILSVNDDIICQRYFRINGYNRDMCNTEEFGKTMDYCAGLIMDDLKYKSFVYLTCTKEEPMKLTGFINEAETFSDYMAVWNDSIEGPVKLSDDRIIDKTYLRDIAENSDWEDEPLEPWESTFKFQFLVDDRPVYERIWDGSQYPKYVRNSVDLSNSDAAWRDREPNKMYFSTLLSKYMTSGRPDLTWKIIRTICDTMSWSQSDYENQSTTKTTYGDKTYYYRAYSKQYVDGWRSATASKTRKYFSQLEKAEKYAASGGLSDGEWNYIERFL